MSSQISDDGSETGSESQYQTANDKEDITVEFDEEEYDSDNSIDLLQPTQVRYLFNGFIICHHGYIS